MEVGGAMSERLESGRLISGRLAVIRKIAGALADDLRASAGDEYRTRGILVALICAIEHDQLDSLFKFLQPWMAQEVKRQQALAEKPPEPEPDGPFTVWSE